MGRRKPRPITWNSVVHGAPMRCSNGHYHAVLSAGADQGRKYLEARCLEPGCGLIQRVFGDELTRSI